MSGSVAGNDARPIGERDAQALAMESGDERAGVKRASLGTPASRTGSGGGSLTRRRPLDRPSATRGRIAPDGGDESAV